VEDPTFGKLHAVRPPQKEGRTFPVEHFSKVRDAMTNPHRAAFIVQIGTGMHATELRRFATEGRIEEPEAGRTDDSVAVLYIEKHKSGLPYRVGVTETVRTAAETLKSYGTFSVGRYLKAVRAACKSVGVPVITSRLVRHTVVSYASSRGSRQAAGEFVGHTNLRTTGIYAHPAPPRVPTIV
jgi:integrase